MKKYLSEKIKKIFKNKHFWPSLGLLVLLCILFFTDVVFIFSKNVNHKKGENLISSIKKIILPEPEKKVELDKVAYDLKMEELANNPIPKVVEPKIDPKTGQSIPLPPPKINPWPVKTVYPNVGALLPFNRIVAYYGNLYSTKMGVLGEYPEEIMLQKLQNEVQKWTTADPNTPAIPALHYIAVTAQGSPGAGGKYRLRMPEKEIDKVLAMAQKINAVVFLDIQVGLSNLESELPVFEKYFKMPNVHLGIDPEFSIKTDSRPGKVIGTFDAEDVNFAANYLAKLVQENNLPPKILIVHRFTQRMVTNYQKINPLPEVQIVMDMDGWGGKAKKLGTYRYFIAKEPVQFTGFKLFYKNDIKTPGTTIFTPEELLKLNPRPIYIQYQ